MPATERPTTPPIEDEQSEVEAREQVKWVVDLSSHRVVRPKREKAIPAQR